MIAWTATRFTLLITAILLLIAVACAPVAAPAPAPAEPTPTVAPTSPPPPPAPSAPDLTVEPGTTEVTATWGAVDGATSYQVRWRHKRGDFADDSITTVSDPTAAFDVGEQGLWVVRVEACNEAGCGRGGTATTPVIIDVAGHQAVRFWFDFESESSNVVTHLLLDWDALPGYYVVKYRTSSDGNWLTSQPLSEPGYSFTAEALVSSEGDWRPVVRVFFNCNESGEGCTLLGRFPDTDVEVVRGDPLSAALALAGATDSGGAAGSESSTTMERDPLTNIVRPASDFTITNEVRNGISYRCLSRPAENPWEKGMFGTANDAIKSCTGGETIDQYQFDPDAVFPDDARCGERPARNDRERSIYGEMVKVCNAHPQIDDSSDDDTLSDGASGQTHSTFHEIDEEIISSTHPNQHRQPYNGIDHCIMRRVTEEDSYGSWDFDTWITAGWCYATSNRITIVRTVRPYTATDKPSTLTTFVSKFKFCNWTTGYSPSNPHETILRYQPTGTTGDNNLLDWSYISEVEAWYGRAISPLAQDKMKCLCRIVLPYISTVRRAL